MFFENATLKKAKLILAQDLKKYLRLHLSTQISEKMLIDFSTNFFLRTGSRFSPQKKQVETKSESFFL